MPAEAIVSVAVTLIVGIGVLALVVLLALLMTRGAEYPYKRERYEAGNPPSGVARRWYPIQYYGYLIIFIAFEPILALLFLLPYYATLNPVKVLTVMAATMAISLPPLYYGLSYSRRIELWRFKPPREG